MMDARDGCLGVLRPHHRRGPRQGRLSVRDEADALRIGSESLSMPHTLLWPAVEHMPLRSDVRRGDAALKDGVRISRICALILPRGPHIMKGVVVKERSPFPSRNRRRGGAVWPRRSGLWSGSPPGQTTAEEGGLACRLALHLATGRQHGSPSMSSERGIQVPAQSWQARVRPHRGRPAGTVATVPLHPAWQQRWPTRTWIAASAVSETWQRGYTP